MASSITDYLRRHGVNPSPKFSAEWTRDNWHNWEAIEEHLKVTRGHTKDGKGKGIICKMLGACLEAAHQERDNRNKKEQDLEKEIEGRKATELLLSLKIEQLQKQLQEEKEKRQKLGEKVEMMLIQAPRPPDIVQIRKLIVSPEDWDGDIWGDPDDSEPEDDDPANYEARPIVKTERTVGPRGGHPRHTMRTIPWDPLQLTNLQERYSRKPGETETEYLWRVCLSGGDRIMLSEDEASGYWGPGVFLNLGPDPTNTPHSITSRVAYWAGGIDSMERGEPSIIPIKSLSELSTAVTKAACIQAMHKRGSHDVPLSATVDFAMLKPLIRGAPAILKSHLVAKRDEIKKDTEHNEGLGDNAQTARKQLPTWADLMHGIVNYSREMGWDDAPAEKQNLKPRGGDHKGGTAGHEVKKRVVPGRQLGLPVRKVEAYQWINDNGPYILIPVGPQRQLVKFLIDTGAQISLLTQQDAEKLGVRPRRQRVKITGVNGVSVQCQIAKVNLWLPGEKRMSSTRFAIKDHHENILGFDVLNGRTWRLPNGSVWSCGSNIDPNPSRNREAAVRALRAAPALPESQITNVPQYPLSAAARNGISEVIADLEKRQIISRTHSPYNSPVWPVRKPDGRWRLTVDYRRLNANTAPLTAAVPNIANLTATLQAAAHPWMAALDVKDMFFMVPLKEEDKEKFAFTWEGIQYTFNRLPQGYKHSPTIAHAALAELLQTVSLPQEVKLYQYIDDILIGGTSPEKVGEAAAAVWQALNKAEIEIPPGKCQGPSKEVKFLGTWWIAGSAVIPPDTLRKIEELQMPQPRKELQQLMGTLGYWRKHVPGFSIISRPLYSLLRKGKPWEWKLEHKEAVKTLTEELKTYQSLGPVHPRDPIIAEWGFAEHATYCNLFQTGPDGPKRPLLFSSTAFKETEQ
ncbi:hypothetical protein QYF61_007358 [Mycteria americana]|uniref:ribonuclease H n=1 Tax=Mycteria americana TaxID=33587 RepID=A0AAN7NG00_MYCAM|nr:hypothetical protein QYF61_007358 [Mycteria americana]